MFGFKDINLSKKPIKPKLYLARPNRKIIGNLSEAFNINFNIKLGSINELNFTLPYEVETNTNTFEFDTTLTLAEIHNGSYLLYEETEYIMDEDVLAKLPQYLCAINGDGTQLNPYILSRLDVEMGMQRNSHIDDIRERYLIKLVLGKYVEWFIINKPQNQMTDNGDFKNVHCYSLGYELSDKIIRGYDTDILFPDILPNLTEVLKGSGSISGILPVDWTIDVPAEFDLKRRSFKVSEKTVLSMLIEVAEAFNALIVWDTENKIIAFRNPETWGTYKGLEIDYGKYLKSLSQENDNTNFCTRLKVYGKDDLNLNEVTITGQPYLEDLSHFIYPFEQDELGNVITHSYYMTDELAKAIINYNNAISEKENEFQNYLSSRENKVIERLERELELQKLEEDLILFATDLDVSRSQNRDYVYFKVNNSALNFGNVIVTLNNINYFISVSSGDNPSTIVTNIYDNISISDNVKAKRKTIDDDNNIYMVIFEINFISDIATQSFNPNSTGINVDVEQVYQKVINKQIEIDNLEIIINNLISDIEDIDDDIQSLRNDLNPNIYFTTDELREEYSTFIVEKTVSNSNIVYINDLLTWGNEQFNNFKNPQIVIDLDIVNFLEIVECQFDWDKLNVSDIITVKYPKFGLKIKAQIIEATFNYASDEVNIIISNIKEVLSDKDKFIKKMNKVTSASASIDMNQYKWDRADGTSSVVQQILDGVWDATYRKINAASNQSVQIDNRGIRILKDTEDIIEKNKYIHMTNGVIGLTQDGGNTFKVAISPEGVYAPRLVGQIIAGVNLTITTGSQDNPDLNPYFFVNSDGVKIRDLDLTITSSSDKNKIFMNAVDGIKIQQKVGTTWDSPKNVFSIDTDGNAVFAGKLSAATGSFSGEVSIGSGNSIFKATSSGIQLGHADFNSAKFRVDMSGNLTASSVNISGTVDITGQLRINGTNILTTIAGIKKIHGNYLTNINASTITTGDFTAINSIKLGNNDNTNKFLRLATNHNFDIVLQAWTDMGPALIIGSSINNSTSMSTLQYITLNTNVAYLKVSGNLHKIATENWVNNKTFVAVFG